MKQPILILLTFLLAHTILAQSLRFNKLIRFQTENQGYIHSKLIRKGWTFSEDKKPVTKTLGKVVWAYKPSGIDANAWLVLYYSDTTPNRVLYNTTDVKKVERIRKRLQRKMIIIDAGTNSADHVDSYTDYADDSYVIRFFSYVQPAYFGIKIYAKEDYLLAKSNNRL
jgi:hypothetical protein